MATNEIDLADAAKLQNEALQLRNQQFQLGTIALAGSGLTAWVAPGLTAVTQGEIPEIALLAASLTWLLLLGVLFAWSLSLRRLIVIISQYLEQKKLSNWEPRFRKFHLRPDRVYRSQTKSITVAFLVYGFVAIAGSVLAAIATPEKIKLSPAGMIAIGAAYCVYISALYALLSSNRRVDKKIAKAWEEEIKAESMNSK
jgi:hypothetical protein